MTEDNNEKPELTVSHAAYKIKDEVHHRPRPARHANILHELIQAGVDVMHHSAEPGFVLSDGRFVRRKAALHVALKAKQVEEHKLSNPGHGLFTDDLW